MINVYPTKYEAIDTETGDVVVSVSMQDAHSATVEIHTVVNVSMWDEIAPRIRQCLVDMEIDQQPPPTAEKG